MLLADSNPADALRWAMDHGQSLIWIVVIALAFFGNIVKKIAGAVRSADAAARSNVPDGRSTAVRAQIVKLIEAAQSGSASPAALRAQLASAVAATQPPAAAAGAPANAYAPAPAYQAAPATTAHPQRTRGHGAHAPAPPQPQRAPAPAAAVVSENILSFTEPDLRPRLAILDAFNDPAGARTAVVLAEILAPPVALRSPAGLR